MRALAAALLLLFAGCIEDNLDYGSALPGPWWTWPGVTVDGGAAVDAAGAPDLAELVDLSLPGDFACTPRIGADGKPCGCCRMPCCEMDGCIGLACIHRGSGTYCANDPAVSDSFCPFWPPP